MRAKCQTVKSRLSPPFAKPPIAVTEQKHEATYNVIPEKDHRGGNIELEFRVEETDYCEIRAYYKFHNLAIHEADSVSEP